MSISPHAHQASQPTHNDASPAAKLHQLRDQPGQNRSSVGRVTARSASVAHARIARRA